MEEPENNAVNSVQHVIQRHLNAPPFFLPDTDLDSARPALSNQNPLGVSAIL
ncbi:hypothetical protein [Longimycelium tulufanense]|uniref:hypothetical protein n=1 Tax=Longimycelium tulufanense TaxID=907463 RepID=UPI001665AF45|nr:hypothetical protein [Longimycelium tulufanense]